MTDLPAAAITTSANAAAVWAERTLMSPREVGYQAELVTAALEAAAPHITAADPTTETEGFRAYKAGLAAGRAEGAAAERQRIRAAIEDEYGPSEARKMRRVLLGDAT